MMVTTRMLPSLLRFVPGAGALRDVKNYLMMFCYFLQPTPANIRSMLLYALKHYGDDERLRKIKIPPPESMPSIAIYHPDAPALFETFDAYASWYARRRSKEMTRLSSPLPMVAECSTGFSLSSARSRVIKPSHHSTKFNSHMRRSAGWINGTT